MSLDRKLVAVILHFLRSEGVDYMGDGGGQLYLDHYARRRIPLTADDLVMIAEARDEARKLDNERRE
jgi:hypothetical protein